MAMTFGDWSVRHLEEFVAHLDRVWSELCEYQSDARTARIDDDFGEYGYYGPYRDDVFVTPEYEFIKVLQFAKSLLQVIDRKKLDALPQPEVVSLIYLAGGLLVRRGQRYLEAAIKGEALLEEEEGELPEEAKKIATKSLETLNELGSRMG